MLKSLKRVALKSLKTSGLFSLIKHSKWRQERLLIIAYHGISIEDEHEWDPELFMHPDFFRTRMQMLKDLGCTVLPLGEAIRRLYHNDLPENCVALTFDDGYYDFYKVVLPILKEFDFPATVYLTTYYVQYNRPVLDSVCSYLLWKAGNTTLDLMELTGQNSKIPLSSAEARASVNDHLLEFAWKNNLSAEEKDHLAAGLARQLKIDYDALCAKRILHLLNPEEVRQLGAEGIDIQLHTHRHRSPLNLQLFRREIVDNRKSIEQMTGSTATHFCYPSGNFDQTFFPWLEELNVVSATTCDPGFASHSSNPLLLPRLVDTSTLSLIEFEGWLVGVSAALPRRHKTYNMGVSAPEESSVVRSHSQYERM
ncbi:MAG: polysaccharide deacetylase family protein [Acidobacteria bacterium]|nr:polysaccharide deacetylase family protein [Acidobacteriota bacterium]